MWVHAVATTYYFPTEDNEDEPTAKEKMVAMCVKGIDFFCVWDCCWLWLKIQEGVAFIVFDPFVELFITLCIVVNTLFMALDHYDMDKDLEKTLKSGNYVSILSTAKSSDGFGSINDGNVAGG